MTQIKHLATITKITKTSIFAEVQVKSACGSCAMRGACGIGECTAKTIEIETAKAAQYQTGETIAVVLGENFGFFALFYGYILPLLLVLAVLFGTQALGVDEISGGIYSIIVLIPYYFGLSLCKKYFSKKFHFTIAENNQAKLPQE